MGFRIRKSISLGKGMRVNLGKNGISSVTFGKRGAPHVTVGKRGTLCRSQHFGNRHQLQSQDFRAEKLLIQARQKQSESIIANNHRATAGNGTTIGNAYSVIPL